MSKAKSHMLMPGETISAAIKKYNLYNTSSEEMILLLEEFKRINETEIFRPGMRVLVPILGRNHDEVFKK